jgi:uncharacterized protein (TIGR02444 family)
MSRPATRPDRPLEMDGDLWRFALSFYREPEVAPACLALQEEVGVDVGILIFAVFAATRGVELSDGDLNEADRLVAGWRSEVVIPLRRLRRQLKTGPAPAPTATTDALREKIKSIELEAERIELSLLVNWLTSRVWKTAGPAQAEHMPGRVARHFNGNGEKPLTSAAEEALRSLSLAARRADGNVAEQAES